MQSKTYPNCVHLNYGTLRTVHGWLTLALKIGVPTSIATALQIHQVYPTYSAGRNPRPVGRHQLLKLCGLQRCPAPTHGWVEVGVKVNAPCVPVHKLKNLHKHYKPRSTSPMTHIGNQDLAETRHNGFVTTGEHLKKQVCCSVCYAKILLWSYC